MPMPRARGRRAAPRVHKRIARCALVLDQLVDAQRGRVGEALAAAGHVAGEGVRLLVQLEVILEVLLDLRARGRARGQ
jgi:hypothetical protein